MEGISKAGENGGTPGRIRTADLLLRRQTLYPAELRARMRWSGPIPFPSNQCTKAAEPPSFDRRARIGAIAGSGHRGIG